MTPERWRQITAIFGAALTRDPDDRDAFLSDAYGTDHVLRGEVESLLAAHRDAGEFGATPVAMSAPPLTRGTPLGPYRIECLIGAGGMGEVYRAHDARLGRAVAVKILPLVFAADPDRLQRFEQEARAAGGLNHPNVVAVYDVGEEDGMSYVVSELLEGESLRARLARGPISASKVNDWGGQIARGLAAAHARDLVHRDVKPENLFVTRDGQVKILDFGLAKVRAPAAARSRAFDTGPGVVFGTVAYMAPEHVRGQAIDHRADLFALGAVLHEMLTGVPVFARATPADTATAILSEEPGEIASNRPVVSALERIARRCLEKRPEDRFQSATDLAFALDAVSTFSGSDRGARGAPFARFIAPGWPRVALVALAIAAAATGGLGVGMRLRVTASPEPVPVRFAIAPPAGFTLYDVPALSPDGRRLALVTREPTGRRRLWLRSLDSEAAQPVAETEGVSYPFWSPDGQSIGFFANGQLKRVAAAGGPAITICDATDGRGGTWNHAGLILFSPGVSSPIQQVPASGGTPQPASRLDPERDVSHRWPHFLPDGDHFLYLADAKPGGQSSLQVGSLRSPGSRKLVDGVTEGHYADGLLFFFRRHVLVAQRFDLGRLALSGEPHPVLQNLLPLNSGRFAFSITPSGTIASLPLPMWNPVTELTWFDRLGRATGSVGQPARFSGVSIAPDGKRVAVTRHDEQGSDIWVVELTRGSVTPLTSNASVESRRPVWSPDGRRVAFTASPREDSAGNVFAIAADGSGTIAPIAEGALNLVGLDWSPDGSRFLYQVLTGNQKIKAGLWMVTMPGSSPAVPYRDDGWQYFQATLSPDGRWVAYTSNHSGRAEIYIERFPSPGSRVRASTDGGTQPRWRRDQKELYYLSAEGQLKAVRLDLAGDATLGPTTPLFALAVRGTSDSEVRGRASIYSPPLYDVAPDGRFLAAIVKEEGQVRAPVTVSLNATAALKRGAPR